MEIVEIIDPELAMCLQEAGFPHHYIRKEGNLSIIAFVSSPEFREAFEEFDEDDGCSIHRTYDTDDGAIPERGVDETTADGQGF